MKTKLEKAVERLARIATFHGGRVEVASEELALVLDALKEAQTVVALNDITKSAERLMTSLTRAERAVVKAAMKWRNADDEDHPDVWALAKAVAKLEAERAKAKRGSKR